MSPFFYCSDCRKVSDARQDQDKCPSCNSTNGRIMSDEEFWKKYDKGAIHMIKPSTGKPIKKK